MKIANARRLPIGLAIFGGTGGNPFDPDGPHAGLSSPVRFPHGVVERWIPRADRRADVFGFADVSAVHPRDRLFLLVQATTASHAAHRLGKAKSRGELGA
jgi:hypothetical protein